jgi:arsenate reductase (thioredoxin)
MQTHNNKTSVLFLCTKNSCRSQMAEGWTHHLLGNRIDAYSAGTAASRLDLRAVQVMQEAGVDISDYRSKNISDLEKTDFDYVITVCDNARENCPWFPAKVRLLHQSFQDPPELAEKAGTEDDALVFYRRVRDEIRSFVEYLPEEID